MSAKCQKRTFVESVADHLTIVLAERPIYYFSDAI
jgi:hypothetical protein